MRDVRLQKGFSIIEIVVGSAIITVAGLAIILGTLSYIEISSKNSHNVQTALLFEETGEAIQFLRDSGWTSNIGNKTLNTAYYLSWSGSTYSLSTTPNLYQNTYTRTVRFQSVERDGNDSITTSGSNDPDTRLVEIDVSWPYKGATTTISTEMLIHNVYDN